MEHEKETQNGEVIENGKNGEKNKEENQLPLMGLNHVSRLCSNVEKSANFYTKVLWMVLIERPEAFDSDGAWLFNYGVGIHLVHAKHGDTLPDPEHLDPMDNATFLFKYHCEDMEAIEERLEEHKIKYIKRTVEDERGAAIDQLFFNDPDGYMIEICNCENLTLVLAGSLGKIKLPIDHHNPPLKLANDNEDSHVGEHENSE
ncbi:Glyoxalase/fosfomycin resistance/dioxygenase domain [Dillenia turbinata]|uniref:Glyoxalase/fosfomycin resistance/dioxygenase domain n=1 Tax=Dillenia turbinata TaxID=194707 RepID=A0AAN8ZB24_9MAGN